VSGGVGAAREAPPVLRSALQLIPHLLRRYMDRSFAEDAEKRRFGGDGGEARVGGDGEQPIGVGGDGEHTEEAVEEDEVSCHVCSNSCMRCHKMCIHVCSKRCMRCHKRCMSCHSCSNVLCSHTLSSHSFI
jgi:hypothetical protein